MRNPCAVVAGARAGRTRQRATQRQQETFEALRVAALDALAAGMNEAEVARVGQVDRMTVRKWQGKR